MLVADSCSVWSVQSADERPHASSPPARQERPDRLLRRLFEQLAGRGHRLVEADRAGADREIGVDALFEDGLGAGADRAGQGQGRAAERAREPGDADGRLAEGALGVDRPFAGQAEVGAVEPLGQLDGLDDQVDARLELCRRRTRPGRRPVRRRRPSRAGP